MKFYAYKGRYHLGGEALGTSGKLLFQLKTYEGAVRRAHKYLGKESSVWVYTSFYDNSTFRRVY